MKQLELAKLTMAETKTKTSKTAYIGDNFVEATPTLPCMIRKTHNLKKKVQQAVKYASKLDDKKFDKMHNTEKAGGILEDDPKRFISKFDLLKWKKATLEKQTWFQHIRDQVQEHVTAINKDLVIDKCKMLKSIKGCTQQDFHTDNDPKENQKRYSIIFSLMEGTSVVFKEANDPDDFGWSLQLPEASMVIFRDESVHAGSAYSNEENYRLFFSASLEGTNKKTKETTRKTRYGSRKRKQNEEEEEICIDDSKTSIDMFIGNLCPGCNKEVKSKNDAKDSGKSAIAKHKKRCVEYLVQIDGMTKKDAETKRKALLEADRIATVLCREKAKQRGVEQKAELACQGKTEEEAEEKKLQEKRKKSREATQRCRQRKKLK